MNEHLGDAAEPIADLPHQQPFHTQASPLRNPVVWKRSGTFCLGVWADQGWGEVNWLCPPLLPCVCTLEAGCDANAHLHHVGAPICPLFQGLLRWPFSGGGTATFLLLASRQAGALD